LVGYFATDVALQQLDEASSAMRLTRRMVVALAALSLQRRRVLGATNRGEGIMTQDQGPLGPLTPYIGEWSGAGVDTVPDGKGEPIRTPFVERVTLEAVPLLTYGNQTVRALRYSCRDFATDDKSTPVYEENGYFIWVAETDTIVLQVSNPRGLSMLATGKPAPDGSFKVTSAGGSGRGVMVTDYLETFINVVGYETSVEPLDANTFRYANDTLLKLPDGKIFHQTDIATLKRQS
jgi:hypothetical protein